MMDRKTDNHDLSAKLELRRHFLRNYHLDRPIHVLDCCQGSGFIWEQLRQEFPISSYWGLDKKKKKGRLAIDSVRILEQPALPQNVIDIDTYGSPWKHWFALLPNVRQPVTVFLTIGLIRMGGGNMDTRARQALGLNGLDVPMSFLGKLHPLAASYCLTAGYDIGTIPTLAIESVSDGNARYIGVRLEPKGER